PGEVAGSTKPGWQKMITEYSKRGADVNIFETESSRLVNENAATLCRTFENSSKGTTVVAYGKSASETMLCLAKRPALLKTGRIKSVVFLQGIFDRWLVGLLAGLSAPDKKLLSSSFGYVVTGPNIGQVMTGTGSILLNLREARHTNIMTVDGPSPDIVEAQVAVIDRVWKEVTK
ncbi:MAG: hypothetical protein ABL958_19600, partial [Bdellovibrionia bacterium]